MPGKQSYKSSYCLYAIVVATINAITTVSLTWQLAGQVQWVWVIFTTVSSAITYISTRILESSNRPITSVNHLNRVVQEISDLRLELASQLRMSQSAQKQLGKSLITIDSTLKNLQVQAGETQTQISELADFQRSKLDN